ncbi:MAG TPA: histidine kinase [Opitutaceae bacterium]
MDAPPSVQLPAHPEKGPTKGPLAVTVLVVFTLVAFTVHLVGLRGYLFCLVYAWITAWIMFSFGSWMRRLLVRHRPEWLEPPWKRSFCILVPMLIFATLVNFVDRYGLGGFYLRNGWLTPNNIERFMDASLLVRLAAVLAVNGYFSARLSYLRMTASLQIQAEALRHAADARKQQVEAEAQRQRAEIEARMAKHLAAEAELTALKMQINPHFLFNTLGSIAVLARIDGGRAAQLTEKLAEMFRYALQASKQPSATLGEEIDFLNAYFEIEQARFGSRLALEISVPTELRSLAVPNLLIQPMVENAVVHAFKEKCMAWRISVSAAIRESCAEITVTDNGRGFEGQDPYSVIGRGTALKNIDERLRLLYNGSARFVIEENAPRGAKFLVRIPLTQTPAPMYP